MESRLKEGRLAKRKPPTKISRTDQPYEHNETMPDTIPNGDADLDTVSAAKETTVKTCTKCQKIKKPP